MPHNYSMTFFWNTNILRLLFAPSYQPRLPSRQSVAGQVLPPRHHHPLGLHPRLPRAQILGAGTSTFVLQVLTHTGWFTHLNFFLNFSTFQLLFHNFFSPLLSAPRSIFISFGKVGPSKKVGGWGIFTTKCWCTPKHCAEHTLWRRVQPFVFGFLLVQPSFVLLMFLVLFCFFFVGVLPCVFRRKCIDVVSIETQRERWENVRNLFLDDVGSVCGTVQVGWTDVVVCFFFFSLCFDGTKVPKPSVLHVERGWRHVCGGRITLWQCGQRFVFCGVGIGRAMRGFAGRGDCTSSINTHTCKTLSLSAMICSSSME